jgi:hypothetical protein
MGAYLGPQQNSLDQRAVVGETGGARGIWPPLGANLVLPQQTKVLLPAPFSPIK